MRKFIQVMLILMAIVILAGTVWSQKAGVIGTAHDVSGNGCKSCHAPHNGSKGGMTANTDQATGKILLWDRAFSAVTFGTYDSPSMNNKATEIGGALTNTDAKMYSLLCMSCHDGVTTGTPIVANSEFAVGNVANSNGLTNDHPVNMNYDPTQDTGLAAIATVTAANLKLYGASNTVQCATCHNVHSNLIDPFLRKSNASSALCTTCHT